MKTILGIAMIIAGIVLGLYVGLWLMFISGIAGLINVVVGAVAGHGISGMVVAIDVVKIMFAGYNGARNTGADVRVAAMVDQFKHVLGEENIETSVMTLNYDLIKVYFENKSNIIPFNSVFFKDLLKAVSSHHLVVMCEGSCFKSKFANALSVFMAGAAGMMDVQGKKAIAYGSEAGDMEPQLEDFVRKHAKNAYIICRTKPSLEVIEGLGMKGELGTDTAWTFSTDQGKWADDKLKSLGWDGKTPIVGLAVINPFVWPVKPRLGKFILSGGGLRKFDPHYDHYDKWYYFTYNEKRREQFKTYITAIADAYKEFKKSHDVFPVIIGMEKLDLGANLELQKQLGKDVPFFCSIDYDGYQMMSVLHKLKLLISSRYHAVVLSMIGGIPSGGITMDERIRNIMEERGHLERLCVYVDDADLKTKVFNMMNDLWDNGDEISESINKSIPGYLEKMAYMGKIMKKYVKENFSGLNLPADPDNWKGYLPPLNQRQTEICKKYNV